MSSADGYVRQVLAKYAVPRGPSSQAERLGSRLAGPLHLWAGSDLSSLAYSGSYAKHTGVLGVADVDLFISLKASTNDTLGQLYESLFHFAANHGWDPRRQNVSIGIQVGGVRADLVPARVQAGYQNYHSLYVRKADSWTQTNVDLHTNTVLQSGRIEEIRAVKIWRMLQGLDFPSLYLELFVIRVLSGRTKGRVAENVMAALNSISQALPSTRIVDPSNTNNVLSDLLSQAEKQRIADAAARSALMPYWEQIIS